MNSTFFDYYIDDEAYAHKLLHNPDFDQNSPEVEKLARTFVSDMRDNKNIIGSINDLLQSYGLDTQEGLALMALAEALLRIPDNETANQLIESKLNEINLDHLPSDDNLLMRAMTWGIGIAQTIVNQNDTPETFIQKAIHKLGIPCIRNATYQMIKIMSGTFILGQTIESAINNTETTSLYSFDMLGEGARHTGISKEYYALYKHAIDITSKQNCNKSIDKCQSVSIKISALHPKFFPKYQTHFFDELYDIVYSLVIFAHSKNVPVTIDAEEADRLEFTINIFSKLAQEPDLKGWNGLGIVIQAYQKRAINVINHIIDIAKKNKRNIPIRLVKGAYWDTEIKRAQERGLKTFPVFTRKALTDLNYLNCAKLLFQNRKFVFPQTATHNALTIAQLIEMAGDGKGWELQRLHGMGEELYQSVTLNCPQIMQRIYAPVGHYKNLLSYLVRRLLENGANSSFVNAVAKKDIPIEKFLFTPKSFLINKKSMRHPDVKLPSEIFPSRINSHGYELGFSNDYNFLQECLKNPPTYTIPIKSEYSDLAIPPRQVTMPATGKTFAQIYESSPETAYQAVTDTALYFKQWQKTSVNQRIQILLKLASLIEANTQSLMNILVYEAGKTIIDAEAELREGVDFCRYYARIAQEQLTELTQLPGPNGECNTHFYTPRGTFICISPWNFPLAIYIGQIAAAIVAGNTVVAKPAEQTPIIAYEIMQLFYQAGLPKEACSLVFGDGKIGQTITAHPDVAGIVFTGSTEVANTINRTMANSDLAIRPLIAETGGLNAMIIDSTALLEQVTDDVIQSAFQSAGQRCSALRILFIQEEIADELIDMLKITASEMVIDYPTNIASDIGPIIDREAKEKITNYIQANAEKIIYKNDDAIPSHISKDSLFISPTILKIDSLDDFKEEIFGPVLHIMTYPQAKLDEYITELDKKGYGLTLGVHSRIPEFAQKISYTMRSGNVYVNRNIIGAVVESQPFGGYGKSGTGPKAGGPDYVKRFCYERVISTNIAAAGGDSELMIIPND